MNTTWTLTKSSFKMFVRNRQSVFFTLFIPVVIMTIFGLIGFDRVPKIDVGIVAEQPNAPTQAFIDQLDNIPAFKIQRGSEADERGALEKGDRAVVIFIPNTLLPDLSAVGRPLPSSPPAVPKTQSVRVLTNVGQLQQASTAISILSQLLDKTTLAAVNAPALFELQTEEVNAQNLKYIDFLLPGIIAMAVMQMAVFSVAFVFVDYKEKGILKRLLATPMKPGQFVAANVIVRLVVALAQAFILLLMGVLIFKTHVVGAPWLIALVATLGGVMFLGLGFTISGIAKTVDAVPAIANLIVFPMMFLGGVFFPMDSMPDWLQNIVQYLPLTHFAEGLRDVMAQGASIGEIAPQLYWMLGWSVVLVGLALFTFRLEERRV